jgi:penicillin amidase
MGMSRRERQRRGAARFRYSLLGVLLIAGLVFGGRYWLRTSLPELDGAFEAAGLQSTAVILRDSRGVPYIEADNEPDAYFALGFAHAQDRLWQMDMQRRIAAGRMAELVGRRALSSDRFMRTLGLARLAERSFAALDEETRKALTAYAAGVNASMEQYKGARLLPLEFLALTYRPESWKPQDSLLWGRVLALQLSGNWREELLRYRLASTLSQDLINDLWPDSPSDAPVTLGDASLRIMDRLLAELPEELMPRLASNAWAVSGGRSISGRPLLANDPHLGFRAPVTWYLASIKTPDFHLRGATLPGMPFVLLGQNDHLAWGITSTHGDSEDLFIEKIDPADPSHYLAPEGSLPFALRRETIQIKGEKEIVLAIRETRHGPVISDALEAEAPKDEVLALAATPLEELDLTAQALRLMGRAGNMESFRAALADFQSPIQNITYADRDGHIGFFVAGRVPMRKGHASPDLPRPGWTGEADWNGYVPPAQMPAKFDPPRGWFVNANNKPVDASFPFHLANDWPDPYRAKRINDLLEAKPRHGADDMAAYQLDTLSLLALDLKPRLIELAARKRQNEDILRRLAAWDGSMSRDLPEPLILNAWIEELHRLIFKDELGDLIDARGGPHPMVIKRVLDDRHVWCDDIATKEAVESCEDMALRSLDTAVRKLKIEHGPEPARWRWGSEHAVIFSHTLFERVPVLGALLRRTIETDGDGFTVNRGIHEAWPFRHVHGAGFRAVYDIADPAASRYMLALGQSGNPFSAHYDDLLENWRDGQTFRLDASKAAYGITMTPR